MKTICHIGYILLLCAAVVSADNPVHVDKIKKGDIVLVDIFGENASSPAIVLKVWEPDEGRNELDVCVFNLNGGTTTQYCVPQRSDNYPSAIRSWRSR